MQKISKPLSDSELIKDIRERIAEVYKIDPAYAGNDLRTHNPVLQKIDIIKQRYKYPTSSIPFLEKAIILLYQILKKIYDSELQQDCNPLNYIVFDDPEDYILLDATIKEIFHE